MADDKFVRSDETVHAQRSRRGADDTRFLRRGLMTLPIGDQDERPEIAFLRSRRIGLIGLFFFERSAISKEGIVGVGVGDKLSIFWLLFLLLVGHAC